MKKLFILLLLAPIAVMAQVPATSAYNTDKAEFFLEDEVNNALSTPDMIMCFMGAMRPDLMVGTGATPTSAVTYLALVDEAKCSSEGNVSQGPQNQSASAGAAANAKSASISYTEAIVTVSKASVSAPMIVKAWILFKGDEGENDQLIYTLTTVNGAATDETPYGDFVLNYTGTESGADVFEGYLQSSGTGLEWRDIYQDQQMGQIENRAILNFGTGATGNGAIQYVDFSQQNPTQNVDTYAYTATAFCRQNQSVNGAPSGAAELCFSTDESKGKKEVFGYKLYDSTTGEQFDLENTGFGIKFVNDASQTVFGWADYWGIHFEESIANSITNGKAFTKDDDSEATVTAAIYNGKLIKRTVEKVTLNSINGLRFNAWVDINSLGINGAEYKLYYDSANARFTITHSFQCGQQGCADTALENPVNITAAQLTGANDFYGFWGWAPGFGAINIPKEIIATPTVAAVPIETESDVALADYPTTLYCVENCPRYTEIEALKAAANADPSNVNAGPLANQNVYGVATNNVITYTLDSTNYSYSAGDGGNADYGTVSDALRGKINETQYNWGAYSGALVTTLSSLSCDNDNNYDYCMENVYNGTVTEYYQWQTGHERWNTLRFLKDSSGNRIPFDQPLQLYFNVPDAAATYAEYAGKEISLDFGGGQSLWGLPGRCVNTTTGVFVEDCRKEGGGYWPWIDLFQIPKNESTGVVYTGRDSTGTKYLVAPAQGAVFLAVDAASVGTLTLGSAAGLPTDAPTNVGPTNGGANYIGAQPAKPAKASVIHGELTGD